MHRNQKQRQLSHIHTQEAGLKERGFTVTELLVVFLIMVLLASVVMVNWNRQKPRRSVVLSQNEFITQIRKVQGYAVSSRNVEADLATRFYVMKLVEEQNEYTVHAINHNEATGQLEMYPDAPEAFETIKLIEGVVISNLQLSPPEAQQVNDPVCAALIFSVVYGKTYFLDSATCDSAAFDAEILTFVSDPTQLPQLASADLLLHIENTQGAIANSLQIDAQTGRVEPYVKEEKKSGGR